MASESRAHSAFGLMRYWLRAHSGSRNIIVENNVNTDVTCLTQLSVWLHGEFQPGLKYCCDYVVNFSPGAERKFTFSARAEIPFRLHETFSDFQARLA